MRKNLFFGILAAGILAVLSLSCKGPADWNNDVENFVDDGLSVLTIRNLELASDGSDVGFVTSEGETEIRINLINPQDLAATYTLDVQDPGLFDAAPSLAPVSNSAQMLTIDPALAAEHQELRMALIIYVPSLNRTYPPRQMLIRCETDPNPVELLIGGKTDNDRAMIAFRLPDQATDTDLDTISITWGLAGSGTTQTNTFPVNDASLLDSPPDGENLLGLDDPLNRYFYPASAVAGSVYGFTVVLNDAYGLHSEARAVASDHVEYSISYDANGADSGTVPDTTLHEFGTSASVSGNTGSLSRADYVFAGWNTEPDGLGDDYTPGDNVMMNFGNLVLYAQWTALFSITYMPNNADGGAVPPATQHIDGTTAVISANTGLLVRTGYLFDGWNSQPDGSGDDYAPGDNVFMNFGNLVLYAQWINFTVSYVNNNPAVTQDPPAAETYLPGDTVSYPDYDADNIVDGYRFLGWEFDPVGNDFEGREPGDTFTMAASGVTFYAVWAKVISTPAELAAIDLDGDYYLMDNIYLTADWTTYIGDSTIAYTGRFYGNNHYIYDLTINSASQTNVGLFGFVGSGGEVHDLNLVGVNVQADSVNNVAALAGSNSGLISNCTVEGIVNLTAAGNQIGGLVGNNNRGVIESCTVVAAITADGDAVGGIAGLNNSNASSNGIIFDCSFQGDVSGNIRVGGIVGSSARGELNQCTVTGQITGNGYVGGIAGRCDVADELILCSVSGAVTGNGGPDYASRTRYFGGLVGNFNNYQGSIEECNVDASVSTTQYTECVGGLIGYSRGVEMTDSHSSGGINVAESFSVGGLVGEIEYDPVISGITVRISGCTASGTISVNAFDPGLGGYGGFIGLTDNLSDSTFIIEGSSASGNISTPTDKEFVGGFIGHCRNTGTGRIQITDCLAGGTVNGWNENGGLIGRVQVFSGTIEITQCHASGNVGGNLYSGGLIGQNIGGTISECYATGNVGVESQYAGFIAINTGVVSDCYATGNMTTSMSSQFSGFIYNNSGDVANSYYSGLMDGDAANNTFVNTNTGTLSACYYLSDISADDALEGNARTDAGMATWGTFTGWDPAIWTIDPSRTINNGYPYLQ